MNRCTFNYECLYVSYFKDKVNKYHSNWKKWKQKKKNSLYSGTLESNRSLNLYTSDLYMLIKITCMTKGNRKIM